MLHSLSWGLGKYYKEREKIWERKLCFLTCLYHLFHLSSHICLSFPFSPSSFFLPFIPSLRFFCFVCMLLIVWNALMAFSQRAPISAALEENGARWRWCWWWYFKSCFLVPLSHPTNPPPLLFFPYRILIPSMLQPSPVSQRDVRTENRVGKQSIGCQYFLVKGSSVTKPVLAESRPDLCCGKATPHRANRDSCKHMVMWQEQKREMHYTKMILHSVFFWKTGE